MLRSSWKSSLVQFDDITAEGLPPGQMNNPTERVDNVDYGKLFQIFSEYIVCVIQKTSSNCHCIVSWGHLPDAFMCIMVAQIAITLSWELKTLFQFF